MIVLENDAMPWEKQFDRREVLQRAMHLFWEGGYEATSLASLLEAMGIQKGSFYATFGCKRQVLLECLHLYQAECSPLLEAMVPSTSPRATLEKHLRSCAAHSCSEEGERGCFIVNIALELSPKDEEVRLLVQRALDAHETHLRRLLDQAKKQGEVAVTLDTRATARGLLALVLGMRVLARASMPRPLIEAARDQALLMIERPS